jgi:glycerol-3-phosphate dehydrogenase
MKRNVQELAKNIYDVVIVGGGIYGACVAWDAALRGLSACLVEKSDFGSATSANSLKIIHGGLRHLQHGDLKRTRESIRERRTWMRIAPHLIHPLPVLIPIYGRWRWANEMLSAALLINDLMGLDRNRMEDPEKYIPRGKVISKQECLELLSEIPQQGLTGGAVFYDAQVYNTERLVLSFLRSADRAGAHLANYVEVIGFLKVGSRVVGVEAKDLLTGDRFHIRARVVVNACGPWLERILGLVPGRPAARTNGYAKAFNLVTRRLFETYAVGIPGANGYDDPGRLISKRTPLVFITPWRDRSLIGTSYQDYDGAPEEFRVTEKDIRDFLNEVKLAYPAAGLRLEDVALVHGGLLPRTDTRSKIGMVELAKKYRLLDHRNEGVHGLLSVQGVKYTTARVLAEKVVDRVFEIREQKPPKSLADTIPIYGGDIDRFDTFLQAEIGKRRCGLEEKTIRRLIYNYGSAYSEVLDYLDFGQGRQQMTEELTVLKAEVIHGVRDEMAHKLSDVVFRRTDVGTAGHPGTEALTTCLDTMSAELGWSPEKSRRELDETTCDLRVGGCDRIAA